MSDLEALGKSQYLLNVIDNISDAFCALDREWRFTYVNDQAAQLLDCSPEDLLGKNHWEEFPETLGSQFEQEYRRAVAEQVTVTFEAFYTPHDRWYAVRAYPSTSGLAIYFQNVTARKQSQEALLRSEERYRTLFEAIDEGYCIIEMLFDHNNVPVDYRFLEVNPAFERHTGLTEAAGKTARQLLPNLEKHWFELYGKVALTGEPVRGEQGSFVMNRWFDVFAFRFGEASERKVAIRFKDISDRKRAEASLKQSEERLSLALEGAEMATWDVDMLTDKRTWSPRHFTILGYSPIAMEDITAEMWDSRIHPDDVAHLNCEVDRARKAQSIFCVDHRIIRADNGEIRWLSSFGRFLYNEAGEAIRSVGIFFDVSERKQAEADLARANGILHSVIDGTSDVIYVKDLQGRYVVANATAAEWLNTTVKAMVGQDDLAFFPLEIAQKIEQTDRQVMQTGESIVFEEDIPKQNVMRSLLSAKYPWRDDAGRIVGVIGISRDISDRKASEAEIQRLNQSLARRVDELQTILDAVPVGIAMSDDPHCKVVRVNEFARSMLTVPPNANVSATGEGEVVRPFRETRHGINIPADELPMQVATAQGTEVRDVEIQMVRADGAIFDWLVNAVPLFDEQNTVRGCVAAVMDVSELKRIAEELRQKNAILEVINQAVPTPIFVKNRQGEIIYANPATLEVLGKPASEVIGCRDVDIYPSRELGEIVSQNDRRIMESGQTEVVEESPDGIRTFVSTKTPYYNETGEVIGLIGISSEITDRVQVERDRYRILQQEQTAREAAENANRIKDEFLAVLSHELRTPLNPILGWAKLLQSRKLSEAKTAEAIATIERNAKLQSQLIEDLLDVSRILRGKLALNFTPVNLETMISSAIETVRLAAENKNITIQTISQMQEAQVSADAGRLQQVIWNLLSNAIKFTPERGQVTVTLCQKEDRACIEVCDTGKGIHPNFVPHVFDHFRQEDGAITRKFGGLGLGLAIARQLVALHGGTISADSLGENLGATFTVTLPLLSKTTEPTIDDNAKALNSSKALPLAGLRILVVDDETDSRDFISFVIEQAGAQVIAVPSAIAALEAIQQMSFDLTISDIGMPDMDGYKLIRQIRQLPAAQGGQIVAIALTAYAGDLDRQQVMEAGFQQHLSKPIAPESLVEAIVQQVQVNSDAGS
jgi:PAS domain S-box-containing protein